MVTASVLALASGIVALTMLMSNVASYAAPYTAAALTPSNTSGKPVTLAVSTPSPTMSADMPGMDMSGTSPSPTPSSKMPEGNMPGMDMSGTPKDAKAAGSSTNRPLAPVLGAFGVGTLAVLLGAGMMRRKDRAGLQSKKAARAAGRTGK